MGCIDNLAIDAGGHSMNGQIQIQLPVALDQYVQNKVLGGRYGSISEVICSALRQMQDREQIAVRVGGDTTFKHIADALMDVCIAPEKERETSVDDMEAMLAKLEANLVRGASGLSGPFRTASSPRVDDRRPLPEKEILAVLRRSQSYMSGPESLANAAVVGGGWPNSDRPISGNSA